MHVVTITHSLVRPRDIDVSKFDHEFKAQAMLAIPAQIDSLSKTGSLATLIPITFIATGVKVSVLVDVNRDVKDIGIIVKSLLNSVTC